MAKNPTQKHGILGGTIKVLMVIIFVLIGAAILALGIYSLVKCSNDPNFPKWISICNIVFGALLLTSPFFLSHKREGLNKVIKVLMVIIFVVIGITLIVVNAIALAKGWTFYEPALGADAVDIKWLLITNLVLGCLLLTSPFFLKKEL